MAALDEETEKGVIAARIAASAAAAAAILEPRRLLWLEKGGILGWLGSRIAGLEKGGSPECSISRSLPALQLASPS